MKSDFTKDTLNALKQWGKSWTRRHPDAWPMKMQPWVKVILREEKE